MRTLPLMLKSAKSSTNFSGLREIEFSLSVACNKYTNANSLLYPLINNLYKAPGLTRLVLQDVSLTFDNMEIIHTAAPYLDELEFELERNG